MNRFTKQYQLWTRSDGYTFTEFDTIEEAVTAVRYSDDWYITKKVDIIINEKE